MTGFNWEIIELREPLWLLLALQPLLLSLLIVVLNRRQHQAYAEPHLLPWLEVASARKSQRRRYARFALMQVCWVLIAIAMAGPRYPDPQLLPDRASAADVMLIVDVSRSMTASDVKPNRLVRAKTELFQFIAQKVHARLGIIVYAGHAHVLSPLTWDRKALGFYAQAIQAGMLPTEGSNLAEAIKLARQELQHSHSPAILVLSDGESYSASATAPESGDIPVHILGVGSEGGTTLVDAETGWLMHRDQVVRTQLNAAALQTLAHRSGGQYATLSDELGLLAKLYQQSPMARSIAKAGRATDQSWVELYAWFLLPALSILLVLAMPHLHNRRRMVPALPVIAVLMAALLQQDVDAQALSVDTEQLAYQAYRTKNYQQALEYYGAHTGYKARMGEAASAYQLSDYARAITQFTQAFLVAEHDSQRADALYNLANSFFRAGRYTAARDTFTDVLRYAEQHEAARANLAFVKSVIESQSQDPFASIARAKRPGRGPRSLRTDENTADGGDFSLSEEEAPSQTAASREASSDKELLKRLASGQARARVADADVQAENERSFDAVEVGQLLQARRLVQQGKHDQQGLWKSLFEEEEGFPAPLDRAVTEAGMPPW